MALTRTSDVMTLHGMESLKRAFRETPEFVKDRLAGVVATSTFSIAQGMRALVRKDTGTLAANISSSFRGLTGRVEIGVDAFYWHFLEYGTVKMAAKPFIRPAAEQESTVFERRIADIARACEHDFEARAA